ncbi:MAG: GGDEF domain-containing protein [Acidobacteriaceae bacterium]|jgi:diguanylate cyclase (GGDEF)-like protein/PAS domain S-box-containing protein
MTPALQLTFATQLRPAGELLASLARLFSSPVGWIAAGCFLLIFLVGSRLAWLSVRRSLLRGQGESFPGELAILRTVMASVPDLIYVKDEQSRFLMANQGTAEVMGASSGQELRGKTDFDYFPTEMAAGFYQDEQKVIQTNVPLLSQDEHIRENDGKVRWLLTTKVPFRDAEGKTIGIIGIGRDVTALKETEAELKRARENLHFKATHDSLTSLLNREAILDMLGREIARSTRENGRTAVLLADLDHFKSINDQFGHPIGDEVLRETARRFLRAVRTYDLVGRLGGEEFLVILGGCAAKEAMVRADQLRRSIEASPISTACGPIPLTISIGVLPAREWGYPPREDVLRHVDVALYAAKADGRNRCRLATPPEDQSLN